MKIDPAQIEIAAHGLLTNSIETIDGDEFPDWQPVILSKMNASSMAFHSQIVQRGVWL